MNKIAFISLLVLLSWTACVQKSAENQVQTAAEKRTTSSLQKILSASDFPSIHNLHIDLEDADGNQSSIPITIIKGTKPGSTFSIISGVHGFEYSSIIAAHELIQEIDTTLLTGTLIIVPLSNPNSFYGRSPFVNPQDDLNLNREFPGNENGSITERIAHFITTEIIPASDVFIDMHGGDANEDLLSFIGYYRNEGAQATTDSIKHLAEVTGFKHIVSWPYNLKADQPAKYAFKQAVQDGKVALIVEAGKLGSVQAAAVDLIKNAVYNMLAEMEMYQKEKNTSTDFITLNEQEYIRSEHKGIFFSAYSAGDKVMKGDKIGVIKDEFGAILKEIEAPVSGTILYMTNTPPINVDETIMCIAYKS